jgi:hypothetical protein
MTAPRQGDVVAEIKEKVDSAQYDLLRAEGRADFDDALRAELAKVADPAVRAHAGEMIRQWRQGLLYPDILSRQRLVDVISGGRQVQIGGDDEDH